MGSEEILNRGTAMHVSVPNLKTQGKVRITQLWLVEGIRDDRVK
jgi:hypothetical protein